MKFYPLFDNKSNAAKADIPIINNGVFVCPFIGVLVNFGFKTCE